jgi:L-fucose isomerase-like protein
MPENLAQAPHVAVILLRAEWFDSVVALPELTQAVQADEHLLFERLEAAFEIAGHWVVNSAESLQACASALRALDADLFILAFQVWAEDFYLNPLAQAIAGRPLAVWCYLPWQRPPLPASFLDVLRGSGPVGTFEGLGTLRNLGLRFAFTHGAPDHPRPLHDLQVAARAAQVQHLLRQARFGLLPARNEQMQSTFVDEFRLRKELGPQVRYLSVGELQRKAEALPEPELQAYLDQLQQYPLRGASSEDLALAARASLGLAHLALDNGLDLLCLEDIAPELHAALGLRPCLYPPLLSESGCALSLEGDLGAATAQFILRRLSRGPTLFVEFWYWDEGQNVLVGGHAGAQDPNLAQPGSLWISQDYEFAQSDHSRGAHFQFIARPGRVTLLQLRGTPTSWQALLAGGEALDGPPRLEGYPHAAIRLDASLDDFVRRVARLGSTQHWIMAYGDLQAEVQALCELLDIPLEVINQTDPSKL